MDFILGGQSKMYDIVNADSRTLIFFTRFGIEPGYGDRSLREVCNEKNIDADFLLLMTHVFLNPDYFPDNKLKSLNVDLLLTYLNNSHKYYLEEKIPAMERLMTAFLKHSKHHAVLQIDRFFKQYIIEVKEHLAYEDETAFPYVARLSDYLKSNNLENLSFDYSIGVFEERHDNIEEKLSDLKNLLIKYLPPADDMYARARLIRELIDFEEDLLNHARIEDKVLIPIVAQLEKHIH